MTYTVPQFCSRYKDYVSVHEKYWKYIHTILRYLAGIFVVKMKYAYGYFENSKPLFRNTECF